LLRFARKKFLCESALSGRSRKAVYQSPL